MLMRREEGLSIDIKEVELNRFGDCLETGGEGEKSYG